MKKTLTILAILVVAIVAMMSSVNAASVTVQPTNVQKVNKGETVTVTVNTVQAEGIQFTMTYNTENFEYVPTEVSGQFVNDKTAGTLVVLKNAAPAKISKVELTFKAVRDLELITDNANETASYPFAVTDLMVSRADEKEGTTANGNLVIKATTNQTPSTPETGNPQGENTTNPSTSDKGNTGTSGDVKVGTDGKTITKLPQTGAPVYICAIAIIAIASAILVVKKIRK